MHKFVLSCDICFIGAPAFRYNIGPDHSWDLCNRLACLRELCQYIPNLKSYHKMYVKKCECGQYYYFRSHFQNKYHIQRIKERVYRRRQRYIKQQVKLKQTFFIDFNE